MLVYIGKLVAQALALAHRLVTPVSGMVVLETAQQERDQGLAPADPSRVPTVPEPGVVALAAVLLAAMLFHAARSRRSA